MRSLVYTMALPLLATGALAQTPSTDPSSGQSTQSSQEQSNQEQSNQLQGNELAAQQQMQKNLQQEGFSDIQIVPRSFLVSAKDKQGNRVMMFITPNSVTAVRRVPGSTSGQGGSANPGGQNGSPQESPSESGQDSSPMGK